MSLSQSILKLHTISMMQFISLKNLTTQEPHNYAIRENSRNRKKIGDTYFLNVSMATIDLCDQNFCKKFKLQEQKKNNEQLVSCSGFLNTEL